MNLPDEKREGLREVLAEHQRGPWRKSGQDRYSRHCLCGVMLDANDVDGSLRVHLADALAPLLAGWDEATYQRGLAEGEARLRARVEAVLAEGPDTWDGYETRDIGHAFLAESVIDFIADLRATLDADAAETTGGGE